MAELFIRGAIVLALLVLATAETYYVTHTTDMPCPVKSGAPCFTLSQYTTKPRDYFASNTTLVLLPGSHSLHVELNITNITFLSIESNTTSHSQTSITCYQSARITLENIDSVSMRGFALFGCMNNEVTRVEKFTLEDCSFQGEGRNGTGLGLNQVSTVDITKSTFSSNTGKQIIYLGEKYTVGGGVSLIYCGQLSIINSTFDNNRAARKGGALYSKYSTKVSIVNSTFSRNTLTSPDGYGGALYIDSLFVDITNSTFSSNLATLGGGAVKTDNSYSIIYNSTFLGNKVTERNSTGGALHAGSAKYIEIYISTFKDNSVIGAGGAASIYSGTIQIKNSVFIGNSVTGIVGLGGALYIISSENIGIFNSTIRNNTVTGSGGAMLIRSCTLNIHHSTMSENTAYGEYSSGGAVYGDSSIINIQHSTVSNNSVIGDGEGGGAVLAQFSRVTINSSTLNNNSVVGHNGNGGAMDTFYTSHLILNCTFNFNSVIGDGGDGGALMITDTQKVHILNSTLNSNSLVGKNCNGGAIHAFNLYGNIILVNCTLDKNTVTGEGGKGGAFFAGSATFEIEQSRFNQNSVTGTLGSGGAINAVSDVSVSTIRDSILCENSAAGAGSAIYIQSIILSTSGLLDIENHQATTSVVYAEKSILHMTGNTTISNNLGSLLLYSSNATFKGVTNITHNSHYSNSSQGGGAVTSFQSELAFQGRVHLMYNRALQGGAIAAIESKLYMFGNVSVSDNMAVVSGGGIYAYQSELNFREIITISRNSATARGGGIHAISSTIRSHDNSNTTIDENNAGTGGGMCLESGAKIYLLKSSPQCRDQSCYLHAGDTGEYLHAKSPTIVLRKNIAKYGGAVYIDDSTSSATCYSNYVNNRTTTSNECFIQTLGLYSLKQGFQIYSVSDILIKNTYFTNNSASVAGDAIFGGLLDRCGVSPFTEILQTKATNASLSGTSYLAKITNLEAKDFSTTKTISSDPVRICFCRNDNSDCSYYPQPKQVRKGQTFKVLLVAVDHINNTLPSTTIQASVSLQAKLGEGQSIQQTSEDGTCTELTYNIFSPHNSEELKLYADGPCMRAGISTTSFRVNIEPCPIGFVDQNLRCECDPILYNEYISNCSIDNRSLHRKDNVWFAFINTTQHREGYILHKYCPFDYCKSSNKNVTVNLNTDGGADEICAFNRSGKLCGSCKDGLSLSLGSSHCRPCSNNWLVLLLVFAVAGVALVFFLLQFNFTVAVGTFNGLIFYANIFIANRATFFPIDDSKFLSVFIAWLNLDFGIETCFYDGMDAYAKTWLQLAFPLYVISLVAAIIIISDHSTKFAMLFVGKNPIQVLATLILLSYTKLLRTIIASLSVTTLQYSDSSHELVWLVDANILYFSPKHIPLFITALVIVLVGGIFTFILFAWQWLVYCPNRGPLRWIIGNTKVIAFMDAYHNPYNKDHRYWIGLLLLVRVVLYLVSALNVLGDPRINLLGITLTISALIFLQLFMEYKHKIQVHKTWLKFILEKISLFNLIALSSVTYFLTEENKSQRVVAYISTSIAFATFLAILLYHTYYFVLRRQLQKISSKLYKQKLNHQDQALDVMIMSIPLIGEEPVSETEIDGSPVHPHPNYEEELQAIIDFEPDDK